MSSQSLSRISSKGQTTIPAAVRKILNLKAGDAIKFEIDKNKNVRVVKVSKLEIEWAKSVGSQLSEWEDDLDDNL